MTTKPGDYIDISLQHCHEGEEQLRRLILVYQNIERNLRESQQLQEKLSTRITSSLEEATTTRQQYVEILDRLVNFGTHFKVNFGPHTDNEDTSSLTLRLRISDQKA